MISSCHEDHHQFGRLVFDLFSPELKFYSEKNAEMNQLQTVSSELKFSRVLCKHFSIIKDMSRISFLFLVQKKKLEVNVGEK